ncbi:MAG: MFS transporter [Pseudomonadota bacterium]
MRSKVSIPTLAVFALPALVSAITHGPIAGILPALYAERFGLDLAVIGTALLVTRIFDAVTDPLIGYASDATQSRWGRRKPWMLIGSLVVTASLYFLMVPPEGANITYFLTLSLLIYLGWTILEIPYASWVIELTSDTKERTKINTARAMALFVGGFLFTIAPALVPTSGGEMNFAVLEKVALVCIFLVPISTFLAVWLVPQGDTVHQTEKPQLVELWNSLKINRPFQVFLVAYLLIGLASGVSGVVSFMYIDSYLEIGNRYAELFAPALFVGPLMLPVWMFVLNRFGKYRITAIGFTAYALLLPFPWFVAPGPDAFMPMLIYYCLLTAFSPLLMITMPTILGDIVDHDHLETGKNRAGQFMAFLALIAKGAAGIGGPIALMLIGIYNYQPGIENSDEAILSLRLVANILPAILVAPALVLLWFFPITDASQKEMSERLQRMVEENTKPTKLETA